MTDEQAAELEKEIEHRLIVLSWHETSLVGEAPEPEQIVYLYDGDLSIQDASGHDQIIGRFRAYYVDIGRAMREGIDVLDALDDHSASTATYIGALFDYGTSEYRQAVYDVAYVLEPNLLILDRVELLPQFRGRGLGLHVLRHMMVRFSQAVGVIALNVFPIQFEYVPDAGDEKTWHEGMALDSFSNDMPSSKEKLTAHYEKLGFVRLDDGPFMVFDAEKQIPSLDEGSL